MSEKVKLSANEAKAIEVAKSMNIEMVVRRHSLDDSGSAWQGELDPLNELTLHTILSAIYNGYEVEQTPEDKVRELYKNKNPFHNGVGELSIAYRNGVFETLEALNIKIEGVNS